MKAIDQLQENTKTLRRWSRMRSWAGSAMVVSIASLCLLAPKGVSAATPGLPFTEDFYSNALMVTNKTSANWSTADQALMLKWKQRHFNAFGSNTYYSPISADTNSTYSLAVGDMDGDGDLDVVAGNAGQRCRLYLNNGTANPFNNDIAKDISTDANTTFSVAIGDMDGDGDLDVVTGNGNQPNRLYLNNGTADPFAGVFGSNISADLGATTSIRVADMDGDGDLDVVSGNRGQYNRLYLNNGTADPFAGVTGINISTDIQDTDSIAVADMNGDGYADVVAGNINQPNRLYLNNGTADPFAGVVGSDITADANGTIEVSIGDVNGDGFPDIVAANNNFQTNRLYLNNGTATPFAGVVGSDITTDVQWSMDITLGDVDGDGDLDAVVANDGALNRLYLNNGTASPFTGVVGVDVYTTFANSSFSVVLADMDGDSDLDLVSGDSVGQDLLFINNGTVNPFAGIFGSNIQADADATWAVATGDVDGDGKVDLVTVNSAQVNRLYYGNGVNFNAWQPDNITADTNYSYAVALGDMDGNGSLDVVVGNDNQPNRLYLNNGTFTPFANVVGSDITTDIYSTRAIAVADMNGDGYTDIVTGNYGQGNRLYLNNGTATPFAGVAGSDISADIQFTWSLALGDMNGDGYTDVVAGNWNGINRLYLNNGTANPFAGVTGISITADADSTTSITLDDVDNDGDLDVIVGNYGQANRLYLNNGTANPFAGVTGIDISTDANVTLAIATGDLNGDGYADVVAGNSSGQNRIYLNNGTANAFANVTGIDLTADNFWTVSLGIVDVDYDGDLDIVAGNNNGGEINRLYLNSAGTGSTSNGLYDLVQSVAESGKVNANLDFVTRARLTPTYRGALPSGTGVDYLLTNNGGANWYQVKPGKVFNFPTSGNDLRWRARLHSLSPVQTPIIDSILIENNRPPVFTGPVSITGSSLVDQTLGLSTVNISDDENDVPVISYRWEYSNDDITFAAIPGQTGSMFYVAFNYSHKYIRCTIIADDGFGGITSTTTSSVLVGNTAPVLTSPSISGSPLVGQTLNIVNAWASDIDKDTVAIANAWYSNGVPIAGAASSTLILGASQAHSNIYAQITANDGHGGVVTATTATVTMQNSVPVIIGAPSIDNLAPKVGDTISLVQMSMLVSDSDGDTPVYSYQWLANGITIVGATASTYTLTTADLYKLINCQVTVNDGFGGTASTFSLGSTFPVGPAQIPTSLSSESVNLAGSTISASSITLGQSVDIAGTLDGVPFPNTTQTVSGASVDIYVQLGGSTAAFLAPSPTTNSLGRYAKSFTPDSAGSWTIQSSFAGGTVGTDVFAATTGTAHTLMVNKATPPLNLSVDITPVVSGTNINVVQGQSVTLSGRLQPAFGSGFIAGQPVDLVLTYNSVDQYTLVVTTDVQGNFATSYTVPASWNTAPVSSVQVQASFAGDANCNAALSAKAMLTVAVPPTAYAVLVEGRVAGNAGLPSHTKTMGKVYQSFIDRNIPAANIMYYSFDPYAANSLGSPAKALVSSAINGMAAKMNANPGPLYLVFINHGDPDAFHIYQNATAPVADNTISSNDVNVWLSSLESQLTASRATTPLIFIDGSCFSGSFLATVSGSNRIVISSASFDEVSYKGALDPADGVREGEFFISELFASLTKGNDLATSFEKAHGATAILTYDPGNGFGIAHGDSARQHGQLDDNGDGMGSDAPLPRSTGQDGNLAKGIRLGWAGVSAATHTQIVQVPSAMSVPVDAVVTYDLYVTVSDANASHVWMEVKAPNHLFQNVSQSDQVDPYTQIVLATPLAGQPTKYRMNTVYTGGGSVVFDQAGRYELLFYARDGVSGQISPYRRTVITASAAGNTPPPAPTLQAPANGDANVGLPVMIDWSDSIDIDGDAVSYRLMLSPNQNFSSPVAIVDNLTVSQFIADNQTAFDAGTPGLKDGITYYWKVVAIDARGGVTESGLSGFTVNQTNASTGAVLVTVLDDATGNPIAGVPVTVNVQGGTASGTTDGSGVAFLIVSATSGATLTINQSGYQSYTSAAFNISNGGTTSVVSRLLQPDTTSPVVTPPANASLNIASGIGAPVTDPVITAFLNGATATDNVGVVGGVVNDAPAIFPIGTTTVTFTAYDAANNFGTATATVTVSSTGTDFTAPVISLSGVNPMTIALGSTFADPGASVTDNVDMGLVATVTGVVDTLTSGTYLLLYNAVDTAGNTAIQVTRIVYVKDQTPPVIALNGPATVTVEAGTSYFDAGATMTDNVDTTNTTLTGSGVVNTSLPGSYTLTFNYTDQAGNAAVPVTRTVNVVDTTAPVITLKGNNPLSLLTGAVYTEAGVTITDNVDKGLTATISGTVDTSTPGTYLISYDVTDTAGNAATTVTRTVQVTAPVKVTTSSSGGGGGCTINPQAGGDPTFALLLLIGFGMLVRRKNV